MSQPAYLFIGTYTNAGSKGIYVYRFDTSTGKAEWVSNTEGVSNPSYLALAPDGKTLYAANENSVEDGAGVSAFAFDPASGKLTFINRQPSGGAHPCYVSVDPSGKWVAVGNYSGGNLSLYPLGGDGSLQPARQTIQHKGSSVDKGRQGSPHVHAVVFSPDGQHLLVPDLGLDKIMTYRFNPALPEPLQPALPPFAATQPGSGPRHLAFHPKGGWVYLMEEMGGSVAVYTYRKGKLTPAQRIAAHPTGTPGPYGSADIHVSPDGRFLYASNRGTENTIAIFSINQKTGALTALGFQPTGGVHPRNFMIDPSGNFLLVANRDSNNVVVFRRNKATGALTPAGEPISIPNPVCLKMMQ